jgi:hypothetical protein
LDITITVLGVPKSAQGKIFPSAVAGNKNCTDKIKSIAAGKIFLKEL